MHVTVSDIPEDGLYQDVDIPVTLPESGQAENARGHLRIFRFGKKVLVEGTIRMPAELSCSRCLREFSFPVEVEFREEYNPAGEIDTDEDHELSRNELDMSYYTGDELDVGELVKEQVLLAIPMKPLCRSECSGICRTCGTDLNEGQCSCTRDEADPRMAPLHELKNRLQDKLGTEE